MVNRERGDEGSCVLKDSWKKVASGLKATEKATTMGTET